MRLNEYIIYNMLLEESKGESVSKIQLLVEAKKIASKIKRFRELWEKYHGKEEEGWRFYNQKTKKFKGRPRTGERFINCVLYQGTKGYSFNSALAICQDICNKRYGQHGCVRIANMIRRAFEEVEG